MSQAINQTTLEATRGISLELCPRCGSYYEIGQWPLCNGDPSAHGFVRPSNASKVAPMVYYENPRTGHQQVPGRSDDQRAHHHLTAMGYQRVEMRPGRQYDQWQQREQRKAAVEAEIREKQYDAVEGEQIRENRKQLRKDMQWMSREGRAFAELALKKSEAKEAARKKVKPKAPYVQAMEYDSSNREAWHDRDGKGK